MNYTESVTVALGFVSIILAAIALYLAGQIYNKRISYLVEGRSTLWKLIVVIIFFVVLRRLTAFMIETGAMQDLLFALGYGESALDTIRPIQLVDRLIDPLIVDSMLIVVFYSMLVLGRKGKKIKKGAKRR